ncbi:MAG: hypothetical protein PHD76_12900 [Methylacidiphilales bacterium]|nr:hypothetical protein [Candidatus Methylacidiphilales bacterium]
MKLPQYFIIFLLPALQGALAQDNAVPAAPAEQPSSTQSSTPAIETTPAAAAPAEQPASPAAPETTQPPEAPKPAAPAVTPKPEPVVPQSYGDRTGQVYIGHRAVVDRYAGWGWIWKEGEGYRRGKWALMLEERGVCVVPGRFHSSIEADNDMEYKIYGEFMPYKGYEPNYDVFTDVFRIKGFELIGKATRPNLRPPAPSGHARGSSSSRPHQVSID